MLRIKLRKHDFATIGRPIAVFPARAIRRGDELSRGSALARNGVKLGEVRISFGCKKNLRSVGRPAADGGADRRACELHPLASIRFRPPQDAIGISDIGDLASVTRESKKLGGNATKVWFNPFGLRIEASQFRAGRGTHCKNFRGVPAGDRGAPMDRAGGQRVRRGGNLPKQTMALVASPYLLEASDIGPIFVVASGEK